MEESRNLAERARHKDKEAFARLYETVYQDLYRFALYTLKHRCDAEDVVADTVADAFAGIHKLRDPGSFKGWIFRILTNKCRRKLKEYTRHTVEQFEYPDQPDGSLESDLLVRQAFWQLTDEERLIISLHLFAGYSSREIAGILHKNENTIRSRESRALQKMKQMLK